MSRCSVRHEYPAHWPVMSKQDAGLFSFEYGVYIGITPDFHKKGCIFFLFVCCRLAPLSK